jgi:O-antigen/teichoic acid export membrane protein
LRLLNLAKRQITPTRYLLLVNIITTALGFAQGIITARYLGPSAYGVIAVIAAMNITVLNLLDIRLADLAGKFYYRPVRKEENSTETKAYRASVLQICLLGNSAISVGLATIGFIVGLWFIQAITTTPVSVQWLLAQAIILAMVNVTNTLDYLQRFSGRFYLMGSWRLVYRVLAVAIFLAIFLSNRTLDGYYNALLLATISSLIMSIGVSLLIWIHYEKTSILHLAHLPLAWRDYLGEIRFLFFGNLLSYFKMLHRGSDVLLVGIFADDHVVGLYRLARSLTDTLNILYDALNQVYYPRFMELLAQGATTTYQYLARRLMLMIGGFTVVVVLGQLLLLEPVLRVLLANRFAGAESAIILMTIPFFFIAGISTWLWPIFVHSGNLGNYAIFNLFACLAQYGIIIGLFTTIRAEPWMAGLGYLAYYCVLFPTAYLAVFTAYSAYLPKFAGRLAPT